MAKKSAFVAKNIKHLRRKMELSQGALAEKLEINRGNISSYEGGVAEPSASVLAKMARLFNVNLLDLIEIDLSETQSSLSTETAMDQSSIKVKLEELLVGNEFSVDKFMTRYSDMQKILAGFAQYHNYKMSNAGENISQDIKAMALDYEKLLELMHNIMENNKELIDHLQANSK